MNGVYEPETAPCGVANLANSLAISCDPRLAGDRFESHSRSPRINQRFLKLFAPIQPTADARLCFLAETWLPTQLLFISMGARPAQELELANVSRTHSATHNVQTDRQALAESE
jgi:hypothetical protein